MDCLRAVGEPRGARLGGSVAHLTGHQGRLAGRARRELSRPGQPLSRFSPALFAFACLCFARRSPFARCRGQAGETQGRIGHRLVRLARPSRGRQDPRFEEEAAVRASERHLVGRTETAAPEQFAARCAALDVMAAVLSHSHLPMIAYWPRLLAALDAPRQCRRRLKVLKGRPGRKMPPVRLFERFGDVEP